MLLVFSPIFDQALWARFNPVYVQLKKEIDEMNSNFNKVYKEKTTDKMVFDNEMAKLQLEIKSLREQVPALKSTQAALSKNTATKDKFIVGVGITAA